MNIEINVSEVDLSSVIGHDTYQDEDGDYQGDPITIADKLVEQLVARAVHDDATGYPGLRKRVEQVRDEEIRKHVLPLIGEAFEKPIQRTNGWGEPAGDPVPLRDIVITEARNILNGNTRHGTREESLARKLIREMVERELRAELSDVIKAEREKVTAAVRAQASTLIAEAVTKGVGGGR